MNYSNTIRIIYIAEPNRSHAEHGGPGGGGEGETMNDRKRGERT